MQFPFIKGSPKSGPKPMRLHYSLGFNSINSGYRAFVGFRPVWGFWSNYFNPMTYLRWFGNFCHRGYYGYSRHDYWDGNNYLEQVILGVVRDLKKNTHGYPNSLADYKMGEEPEDPSAPADTGPEKWDAVLSEIIEGLEAAIELTQEVNIPDGIYGTGPTHFEDVEGSNGMLCTLVDDSPKPFDGDAYRAWQAPLLVKRKRAMLLLCRHWESLWD